MSCLKFWGLVSVQTEDIVVIGAGPYGLSIASHLVKAGGKLRVFGTPMQTWRSQMPQGMRLKSEGFASTLYDPAGKYPIARFCEENAIPYADVDLPVQRQTFADYGLEFAKRYVPMLEDRTVSALRATGNGFEITLQDGGTVKAAKVVAAIGITHYAHIMPELAGLPPELASHSSAHHDLSRFAGQTVAVVGAGASATDCAALLSEAGATTHLFTRRPKIDFHAPPRHRGPAENLRAPRTTIGRGWKSVLCTRAPLVFHAMPENFRVEVTRRYLGPSACWFVHQQIDRGVTVHTTAKIERATAQNGRVLLEFSGTDCASLEVDHVIAATGYRPDVARLPFLDAAMVTRLRTESAAPALSRNFESSVPGLYFVGPSAANSFGPLMRFACGAQFVARRLRHHLG